MNHTPLIMASTSAARRRIMEKSGLKVDFQSPDLDEEALRLAHPNLDPKGMAQILANAKACSISAPDRLVIGADQTLELNGRLFSKPHNLAEARQHLLALRGHTHLLHSAVACSHNGHVIFSHVETARMTMRPFSEGFLETYLSDAGGDVLHAVGCYFYESLGIQLFDRVEGDYYTILGLPLLPLLAFLRKEAMLEA